MSTGDAIRTSSTYTADGNYLASSTDALGNTTTYQTNTSTGNAEAVTTAAGVTTSYGYDTAGLHNTSVTVKKSDTTLASVGYVYDEDRLTGINVTNGTSYTLTYDSFGRSSATYVGSNVVADNALAQYIYNNEGLLDKLTYGNGQYVNYSYDPLGRQTKVWYNGNATKTIETVYNGRGQMGLLKDPFANTRTRYEYDLAGRLVEARRTRGAAADADSLWARVNYQYEDGTGRLQQTTVKSRVHTDTTGYVYGDATQGQMADSIYGVKQGTTTQVGYTYDSLGRLTSRTLSVPGWTTSYTYTEGAGSNTTSTQIKTVTSPSGTYTYNYDEVGNIGSIYKDEDWVASYTYDSLSQLTYAALSEYPADYYFTYDDHGNMTSWYRGAEVTESHSYTYGDSVWKDKLTAYDGTAITYDAIGNPLTYRDGMTFTWQNGRQLATATVDGVTASYVYNADGGRHSKTVGGVTTEYYYVDGVLYAQVCGDNTLVFWYDDTGRPYAMVHNGTPYYYEYNLQGDVVSLIDTDYAKLVTYIYGPYGDLLSLTDTSTNGIGTLNPFRYRGYYYDHETGLYYCNSRYYDPETCRWINADGYVSTGQGIIGCDMYAYCLNNPVMHYDAQGAWAVNINVNANLTFILGVTIAFGFSFDGAGNFEWQWSYAVPGVNDTMYAGAFDAGAGVGIQMLDAETVYDMHEYGSYVGASGGSGWYVGADFVELSKALDEDAGSIDGIQITAGVGVGIDVHMAQNYTSPVGKKNNSTSTTSTTKPVTNSNDAMVKKYTLMEKRMGH